MWHLFYLLDLLEIPTWLLFSLTTVIVTTWLRSSGFNRMPWLVAIHLSGSTFVSAGGVGADWQHFSQTAILKSASPILNTSFIRHFTHIHFIHPPGAFVTRNTNTMFLLFLHLYNTLDHSHFYFYTTPVVSIPRFPQFIGWGSFFMKLDRDSNWLNCIILIDVVKNPWSPLCSEMFATQLPLRRHSQSQ